MANTITNSFITEWSDDVKHEFQQLKSNLRSAVRTVMNVEGSTYKFHKLDSVSANTKTRNADLTYIEPQHSVATATLADYYAPIPIDKLDMPKVGRNPDMRREYVTSAAGAINRKLDEIIVAALDASSTAMTTATGALTYPRLLEILELLNAAEVDAENRFLVVTPGGITDALNISQLTSADYFTLNSVMSGSVGQALGFKWIMSNRLTQVGSPLSQKCYGFQKSAVGLAVGQDVQTEINYVPHQALYLVNSCLSAGAVTIEAAGVVQMDITA